MIWSCSSLQHCLTQNFLAAEYLAGASEFCFGASSRRLNSRLGRRIWTEYWDFLQKLQVDNFGLHGSSFVLQRLGIGKADAAFAARAQDEVKRYVGQSNDALRGLTNQDVLHNRVCSFAEFDFSIPGKEKSFSGKMIRENGFWSASRSRGGKCRWLRAASLKVGALVDRSFCSEFQTLEEPSFVIASSRKQLGLHCWRM
eukprot:g888.t1